VDKPAGPTSHDVVARVRRALASRAVGHTGTLDPFATGLLVILVGRATRLARFVEQQPKTYLATACLGAATTTDDLTGQILGDSVDRGQVVPSPSAVAEVLRSFLGPGRQRPPAFSAKLLDGERSYARARRGEAVELAATDIVVHAVELVGYEYPEVRFRATVSAGTYLRAMARDLGERLGTRAHLRALRRESIGPLRVEQAVPLDRVDQEALLPPLAVLGHLPSVEVTETEALSLGHGRSIARRRAAAGFGSQSPDRSAVPGSAELVALTSGGRLIAVARWIDDGLHPEVVLEAVN
jgi:tRNA pseudouridine55 synthase